MRFFLISHAKLGHKNDAVKKVLTKAHQYIPVFALPSSYKTKKLDTRDNIVLQALKKLMFLLFESFYPSGLF
jgi:hypothetical protein